MASRGVIRPRPRCAPPQPLGTGCEVLCRGRQWKREGVFFWGGGVSAHLPAPLAQGHLPELGSRLP